MKRWKAILGLQIAVLLVVASVISFGMTANGAEQLPYEYTFEKDPGAQFNGIDGVKKIRMTFHDKNLSASDIMMGKNVYVLHGTEKVNILQPIRIEGNTVTMSFKNLEYLDHSTGLDYEIVIEKDAKLHFDQLRDYRLPFKLYEVLPGFESVFIKSPAETINMNILKNNSYRDIAVYVPKIYLTGIETIHRYKGVADPGMESHSMTNMDVQADAEATRLTVSVNDEEQYARDLEYRAAVKGFTLGQAGLDALVCEGDAACTGTAKDFHLTAFDQYGKVLTNRNFKVRVTNQTSGFTVNDYIAKPDKIFGQQTTVYALMQDPKLLQTIASQIPVTELDTLGILYSLGSKTEVENYEQLQMAMANPTIKTITLKNTISGDVSIKRNLMIDGDGHGILGNVTMQGTDITSRLKDTMVSGDLTIDVGAGGFAVLENTQIDGFTTATSGSLHFFNVTSPNDLALTNTAEMRVTSVGAATNVTLHSNNDVTFIGTYGDVTVNNADAKLTIKNNTSIEKIIVESPNKLTLTKPQGKAIPTKEGSGEIVVIDTDPIEGEGGQSVSEWYYPEILSQSADVWEHTGVRLTLDQSPTGINWSVVNPKVFGGESQVIYKDGLLHIVNVSAEQTKEVVLQGVYGDQLYRVTILVEIDLQY